MRTFTEWRYETVNPFIRPVSGLFWVFCRHSSNSVSHLLYVLLHLCFFSLSNQKSRRELKTGIPKNLNMSWDTTACFKAVCSAFSDFQRQPSEQTVQDLQRQIDVILGVISHGGATFNDFTPKQLIYAETLSALVSVVNEPNLKTSLYLKSLMVLSELANNDLETKFSLQNDFNLASSVVPFILGHSANITNKQMILQALILLEKMTYGTSCNINNMYMMELLKYLVKSIYTAASELCLPSLAVLSNLCRNNENVKSFVKTMDDAKKFGKILLSYLSNSNKSYSITSLSIMTSLYLNDALGENMFSGQNLSNMIRLVFKVLLGSDDVTTRYYSIDLIIDFIRCPKTMNVINENGMLESDIYQILNLLHSTDAKTAIKIFELLIEFCQQPCLRTKVFYVFIKNSNVSAETQLADEIMLSPAQSLLHWISSSGNEDTVIQANILSLVFLKELFTESVSSGSINHISFYISQVFPILLPYINLDVNIEDAKEIKQRFRRVTSVFEILSTLCKHGDMKTAVIQQVDIGTIFNLIGDVLNKFSQDLNALRDPALVCSQEIILLVFQGLALISTLKHDFDSGLVRYSALIQNVKLIPFISHALTSNSKFLVHASLQIIAEGIKIQEFQCKTLGDTLTFHNTSRLKELAMAKNKQANEEFHQQQHQPPSSRPLRDITSKVNTKFPQSAEMTSLTEKLKKGLDIKDTKVSDIMDFYEHKLSSLIGSENHIQDLLEAKSTTLTQTERLLSQYRCRHAQCEAECLKLRSILQTTERKCEIDTIKINEYTKAKQKLDGQVKTLQEKVKMGEVISAEYEQLQNLFSETSKKLESVQRSLVAADEEHNSLVSVNDCLLKNSELLKNKLDGANERLRLLEEEKQTLLGEIKENDKALKKLEKCLKDSKGKVASVEDHCRGLEKTINEKESTISHLQVELEKQSQISAMIHNLTMGKLSIPNASSSST